MTAISEIEFKVRADHMCQEDQKKIKKQLRNATISERDEDRLATAVFLDQVRKLKYKVGQKLRITTDRESDQLQRAKAVVIEDCARVVVLDVINGAGQRERMQLLKVDILRGHTGTERQERKGALRVELY